MLNLIEFNLTKAEQVSALTKHHTQTETSDYMIKEMKVTELFVTFEIFGVRSSLITCYLVLG